MTMHECPRHGTYGRPESEEPVFWEQRCAQCTEEHERAVRVAKEEFENETWTWTVWQECGIPTRYRNRTLANWSAGRQQTAAKRIVQAWLDDAEEQHRTGTGLLLQGAPGVGKTHLLAGLCADLITQGCAARYASWPDVWAMFRPPFAEDREGKFAALARIAVLALDEIGLAASSEKEQARLFELIDQRYRQRLPTLIATNLTTDTLDSIGERTADRLREVCIPVSIPGVSYRSKASESPITAPEPFGRPRRREVVSLLAVKGQDVERRWASR